LARPLAGAAYSIPAPYENGNTTLRREDRAAMRDLPLEAVIQRCRESVGRYEPGQPSPGDEHCHELFRRAICEFDQRAWEAVFTQYNGLVLANVQRHPWAASRADHDYLANRAFERFWKAIGPDRFEQFANLAALLAYLKTCVHSAVVNEIRANHGRDVMSVSEADEDAGKSEDIAGLILNEIAARDLWAQVQTELRDEPERVVAHLSFVLDYKPSEIQQQRPDLFPTIKDVYRIKHNIVDRLTNRRRLGKFLA
jgi:DNA-directed RNA polymerase specialized sigma24 family protein